MSFNKYRPEADTNVYAQDRSFDVGLQTHMQKVYNTMCMGLVVTGVIAFLIANIPTLQNLIFNTPLKYVAIFGPIAIIWFGFSPAKVFRMPLAKAKGIFYLLASLYGASFASIFLIYSGESIARAFFMTAGMFAATSLYGYTTKKSLTSFRGFLMMGVFGVIIASVVNMFIGSGMLHFVISIVCVLVFTGLTAYETQNIKQQYSVSNGEDANAKLAILGSFSLYLNFIILFQSIMNLTGER